MPVNPPLSPDDDMAMAALGVDLRQVEAAQPLSGGLSGAALQRLTLAHITAGGATRLSSRILKRMAPDSGWLGAVSGDTRIREAQLWASGTLAALPSRIATAYTNAATWDDAVHTPAGGALLLSDERGHLLRNPLHAPNGRQPRFIYTLLDRMAEMHARSWNSPALDDPALGLMAPCASLLLMAPETIAARIAQGDTTPYLPMALTGWEAFFQIAPAEATATLRGVLDEPEPMVAVIASLPRALVHGDIWGPNLGWLPSTHRSPRRGRRLLLLDWALAMAGPSVYDPLWLCGTWHTLYPPRILAAYRARLEGRLNARGVVLAPHTWLALADAGYLRTALTCGEAFGRVAHEAPAGAVRKRAEQRVRWWASRAALAAHRLTEGWGSSGQD